MGPVREYLMGIWLSELPWTLINSAHTSSIHANNSSLFVKCLFISNLFSGKTIRKKDMTNPSLAGYPGEVASLFHYQCHSRRKRLQFIIIINDLKLLARAVSGAIRYYMNNRSSTRVR